MRVSHENSKEVKQFMTYCKEQFDVTLKTSYSPGYDLYQNIFLNSVDPDSRVALNDR